MAEPVEINSGDLLKEVGLLHMEVKIRAARETVLEVRLKEALGALEVEKEPEDNNGG
ncbi:hypothetical protein LCGC14_2181690 [marine sediment metagenome]|uniref:Uncharacterized protein n=1 Tax=marine sediment metagenome TaxID=412755 RepID=A0A0F9E9C8_9ZZZZ